MIVSETGMPGQPADLLDSGDVAADGGLLSVAEIQQAFRELRERRRTRAAERRMHTDAERRMHTDVASRVRTAQVAGATLPGRIPPPAFTQFPPSRELDPAITTREPALGMPRLRPDWIAVLAAHSGAGASCIALAVAHALAHANRLSRVIEVTPASRSGLGASATAQLGIDSTGHWRRGMRTDVSVYCQATDGLASEWPGPAGTEVATVVDLGVPAAERITGLVTDRPAVILVCRPTLPGVRAAEHLLSQLRGMTVAIAAVGPRRWPREVQASAGPLLRTFCDADRLTPVPHDPGLEMAGATTSPLPKSVVAAGRALLRQLDTVRGFGTVPHSGGAKSTARHAHRPPARFSMGTLQSAIRPRPASAHRARM